VLEYSALALLGLVVLAGLLYVTMSPEVEYRPATKAPTPPIGTVETSQSLLAVVVGKRTASRALRRDFFLEVGDLLECGHKCIEGVSVGVRMTKMSYKFHTQEAP